MVTKLKPRQQVTQAQAWILIQNSVPGGQLWNTVLEWRRLSGRRAEEQASGLHTISRRAVVEEYAKACRLLGEVIKDNGPMTACPEVIAAFARELDQTHQIPKPGQLPLFVQSQKPLNA